MHIGIVGGGPSAMFVLKRFIESGRSDFSVDIFEKKNKLGAGMPYSDEGARAEHITNVSGNEIPDLLTSVEDWVGMNYSVASRFDISVKNFNEYKVLPRLLFGEYLSQQFNFILAKAERMGLKVNVHYQTHIKDIRDLTSNKKLELITEDNRVFSFDKVVVCSGHYWPKHHEGIVPGYFDSPYPPDKLTYLVNQTVAIRGASLTAIDALRTLALNNGSFSHDEHGKKIYRLNKDCPKFKIILHSRNGLLPAVRFHLEDSHLAKNSVLDPKEVAHVRAKHHGFLPLDYVYQRNFLEGLKNNRPDFYELIKDLSLEEFVELMMIRREDIPAFDLLKAEYVEAERSIALKRSVYWKEMLAILSFAMNYPAKYFSAEDMLRLQKTLMPLIAIIIAFAPQDSVEEMIALYEAGLLDLITVGDKSEIETSKDDGINYHYTDEAGQKVSLHYDIFIDCIGQPHLNYDEIPFPSLIADQTVSAAKIKFSDYQIAKAYLSGGNKNIYCDANGDYYLKVPGITIDDHFRVVNNSGEINEKIYVMAVPFIGGFNPDYSGLDFGEAASARIIEKLI
ncbi:FAD/NAD(P)-binding protein [Mucilaginibacter jinjuensis]|uniref:FAD/NAD(P)-binding protein n=1 Tax=Mucilaginibacter jinjuensis TaxID=1176721 RepID=A0ABY7TAE3_9SPHI|nr:FAD/NAD(P)-binding protein [Mucilaginibacter jinjuensis]WCT13307.1 FAD/NAD(P)-binding protein [Mucilaginibacter jinjuensis]